MDSLERVREKIRRKLEESVEKPLQARKYCLLIVEDEELNLQALVMTFQKDYEVLAFSSAVTAMDHVKANKPRIDLVLTDQRMPKMSGIQFLEEIKKLYPGVMRLVLTGYTETRDLIDAINKGEVHRYITKPADPAQLRVEVAQALDRYEQNEEKSQMVLVLMDKNKTLENLQSDLRKANLEILQILGTLVELKDPEIGRHALFVAQAAEFIAQKLNMSQDDILRVVQAAHLHDLGKMGLPDWVVKGAGATTEAAEKYYEQHPLLSEAILLVSDSLRDLAPIVRHHHECWNGDGFPDKLRGEAIPLASRIIAIPDGYDEHIVGLRFDPSQKDRHMEKGIQFLKQSKGLRFDPNLVDYFLEFLKEEKSQVKERFLSLGELEEGMTVSQDVLTERGFVIIPKGTRMKKDFLVKVKGLAACIGLRQPIAVYE